MPDIQLDGDEGYLCLQLLEVYQAYLYFKREMQLTFHFEPKLVSGRELSEVTFYLSIKMLKIKKKKKWGGEPSQVQFINMIGFVAS